MYEFCAEALIRYHLCKSDACLGLIFGARLVNGWEEIALSFRAGGAGKFPIILRDIGSLSGLERSGLP